MTTAALARRAAGVVARSVRRSWTDVAMARRQPIAPVVAVAVRPPDDPPGAGPAPDFDGERAFALLTAQCAAGSRAPGSAGHDRVRGLLLDELAGRVDELATQTWEQPIARGAGAGETVTLVNVLGRIGARPGSGAPTGRARRVMVATHWDTRPVADHDPDPARRHEPVAGASDGASGVAVLLELARVLAASRPDVEVLLAFLDGEDLGEHYYGSRQLARALLHGAAPGWRPDEAIVVDMIGGRDLRVTTEIGSIERAPDLWNAVHRSVDRLGLGDRFHGPAARVADDHVQLDRAGIPSILLIDRSYPHWHTTGDTPEHCSPAALEAIGRVLQHHLGPAATPIPPIDVGPRARAYRLSAAVQRRLAPALGGLHAGLWLGLLDRADLHQVDQAHYSAAGAYLAEAHNRRGLFAWEEEALAAHLPTEGRVVVVGAGGGREVVALAARGYEVVGYECHPDLLRSGQDRLDRLGLAGCSLRPLERDRAPAPDGPVDAAIVGWSAYMLVGDRASRVRLLRDLAEPLPPGGPVLLSFFTRPDGDRRAATVRRVAAPLRRLRRRPPVEPGDDLVPNFVHRFTRDEVEAELDAAGLRLVAFAPQGPGPYDSGWAVGTVVRPGHG